MCTGDRQHILTLGRSCRPVKIDAEI
jgi:hypothetical protein